MSNTPNEFNLDQEIDRRAVPALKIHRIVLGEDGTNLFAAGVADMDFRAPPVVLEALQKRLDHGVFGYEAVPDGLFPALINWYKTHHHWSIDSTQILRAPNVLNALAIAASLFATQGDGIIVQPPVFFDFFDIIAENHRKVVHNPLILKQGRYHMDFAGLEALAKDPKNTMLYLCNPHNPVGRVWTRAELQKLADICRKHSVLIVSDEIHGDLTYPGHDYTPLASLGVETANNAIICLSPAKSFNIAACCSAFTIIADVDKLAAFQVENSRLTVNKNNAFASVAMQAAYESGRPWIESVMRYLGGNLTMVKDYLGRSDLIKLVEPEGTFLVWLDFRALKLSPEGLTEFLRKRAGWALTRGPSFGTQGQGFARLNIACPKARLEHALQKLTTALEMYK